MKASLRVPAPASLVMTRPVRKVRVLQVIDRMGDGGAEALLVTFAAGLDRTRFEPHLIALRPAPDSRLTPELRALGVPVTELDQHNAYDIPALLGLVRYIRRHHIDIVHTHLLAADIMGRVAGALTGRPVVSTIHNNRTDLDEEPRRRQWMERWSARLLGRRLVVVSELLREEIAHWFGLPPDRVITIANGVDTERFRRDSSFDRAAMRRALTGGDYPLITNVARLVPQKAQHHLLEAARIALATCPDLRFVLLGDGPLRGELEAQAAALGIADQVIFTGFRPDVADILAASDVFVLSSLWEGMPVALLEAMAAGCTAVSTDVGGVGQVLQHEQTGLLVPPGDPPALAAALVRCCTDPAAARRLAAAGQTWVAQDYGMQAWCRKWQNLYLRELRRKR
jgi:glycosyltransferase involved in cell wall biosynthesis